MKTKILLKGDNGSLAMLKTKIFTSDHLLTVTFLGNKIKITVITALSFFVSGNAIF